MEKTNISETEKELRRIKKLFKEMPDNWKKINEKLLIRAANMAVFLADMEERLNSEGLIVTMPQGDYEIDRAHPLLQQYNSMVKNYNATIKQLSEALPPAAVEKAGSELMKFVQQPKPTKKAVKTA
jgi:hypothetical protein